MDRRPFFVLWCCAARYSCPSIRTGIYPISALESSHFPNIISEFRRTRTCSLSTVLSGQNYSKFPIHVAIPTTSTNSSLTHLLDNYLLLGQTGRSGQPPHAACIVPFREPSACTFYCFQHLFCCWSNSTLAKSQSRFRCLPASFPITTTHTVFYT